MAGVLTLALVAGLMVANPTNVSAVHTGGVNNFFELGPSTSPSTPTDIADNGGIATPDWGGVFNADGSTKTLPEGAEASFIADGLSTPGNTDHTTFSGSNKNNDAVGTWNWDTGNVPVKDDLSNVYAYAAKSNGDLIIYAGLERLSPNGDSHIDIEFNQKEVSLDRVAADPDATECDNDQTAGPGDGPPCEFVTEAENQNRTEDDFIVSLDYTKGGTLGSLEVRKFDNGNFVHVFTLQGQGCNANELLPDVDPDAICGFTNGESIPGGSWTSFNTKGPVPTLATNTFAEFGINITEVLGDELCFATFGVHTRSSASFSAELKDFAVGGFQVCHPDTELRVSAVTELTFYEENTGSAPLDNPFGDLDFVSDINGDGDHTCDAGTFVEVLNEDETHNVGDVGVEGVGVENNKIDPGETFQFKCTVTINSDDDNGLTETEDPVTIYGTGHGIFSGEDRTFCRDNEAKTPFEVAFVTQDTMADPSCDDDEQRIVTITIGPGVHDE